MTPEMTLMTNNEEPEHAILAPSSMKMFMRCAASLFQPAYKAPSEYAEEGTKAHKLLEKCLRAETLEYREVLLAACEDKEMRGHIKTLVDKIDIIVSLIGKDNILETFVEKRVYFSENIYGTLDFGILYVRKGIKKAYILDLKYGQGTPVAALENEQLLTYLVALLLTAQWDAKEATIAIYQPRNFEVTDKPLDQWSVKHKTIKQWESKLKRFEKKALKVLAGEVKNIKEEPGEHCKFCGRKAVCKGFAKHATMDGLIAIDQAEPLLPLINTSSNGGQTLEPVKIELNGSKAPLKRRARPQELTDAQLDQILLHADDLREFLKAVEAHVAARAMSADPLPGWKLVEGRSNRVFKERDPDILAEQLKEIGVGDPFIKVLKNLGDLEDEVGKKKLAPLLFKPPGKPKLVRADDPRPAITSGTVTASLDILTDISDTE